MGWTPNFVHCGPATRFSEVRGTAHRVYGVLESKQTACISKHFDVKTSPTSSRDQHFFHTRSQSLSLVFIKLFLKGAAFAGADM